MQPLIIRLPPRFGRGAIGLAAVAAREAPGGHPGAYALASHERRFARALLLRRPNLWLFRCHQRRFCGDFAIVDMSSPFPTKRPVWVAELKRGARLCWPGPTHVQLRNAAWAVHGLVARGLVAPCRPRLVLGPDDGVLSALGAVPLGAPR